jgi:hypothetical protein
MTTKKCSNCNEIKDAKYFGIRNVSGKQYLRSHCRVCHNKVRKKYPSHKKSEITRAGRRKQDRLEGKNIASCILVDSRRSDKKKLLDNDLDLPFISDTIDCPCSYCGETNLRMTLDRIDNTLGHLKSNVVPACIRCNYARGNMPHEAWLLLTEGLTTARIMGLFGDWVGRCYKQKNQKIGGSTGNRTPVLDFEDPKTATVL